MNAWLPLSVAIFFALAAVAGVPAAAQDQDPDDESGETQDTHNATGPGNSGQRGNSGDARAARECQDRYQSGDQNVSDPEHPCHRFYVQGGSGSSDDRGRSERLDRYQAEYEEVHMPRQADARDGPYGRFQIDPTGYQGRFVSFVPNRADHTISDIKVDGLQVIDTIETPGPVVGDPRLDSNRFAVHGDDWELRVNDHAGQIVAFETDDDAGPFLVTFPEEATVTWEHNGVTITYPTPDGKSTKALMAGDVEPFTALVPLNNTTGGEKVLVVGKAGYVLQGNPETTQGFTVADAKYEAALLKGTVGAEMKLQRGSQGNEVRSDTTIFGDMDIAFESSDSAIERAPDQIYTITIDSPSHEGKTISVSIESGLVDPNDLVFRYFNVNENETVQASIVQASHLDDVLDPLDDGVVAEYWVVEDMNGVHALISIPHFSIHKIEMQNIGQIVIEQPSLVLGVLGAVLVVGVATRAIFRTPRED